MKTHAWNTAILTLLVTLTAAECVNADEALNADGPFAINNVPVEGIQYQLAIDVLAINASRTTTTARTLKDDLSGVDEKTSSKQIVTVNRATIGDPLAVYVLDLNYGAFRDDNLTVAVSESGLLKSINQESTGQVGSFLTNLGKFVSTILGAASILDAASVLGSEEICQPIAGLPTSIRERYFDPDGSGGYILTTTSLKGTAIQKAYITRKPVAGAADGCRTWQELEWAGLRLRETRNTIDELETLISKAPTSDIPGLRTRLNESRRVESEREARVTRITSTFNDGVAKLSKALSLGVTIVPREESFWLRPDILPARAEITGKSKTEIKNLLSGNAAALNLLERFDVAITVDFVGTFGRTPPSLPTCPTKPANESRDDRKKRLRCEAQIAEVKERRAQHRCGEADVDGHIFFRPAQAAMIEVFELSGEQNPTLSSKAKLFDQIIANTTPSCIGFESSSLANRSFSVEFDSRGRPSKLGKTGTSTAAALAEGLASAATTARDTYAETLKSSLDIRNTQRELAISDYKDRTAELVAKNEQVSADIALQSSTSTREQTLELASLRSQISVLEAQLERDRAEFNLSGDPEVREARAQLELLKQQIELDIAQSTHQMQIGNAVQAQQLMELQSARDIQVLRATNELNASVAELTVLLNELKLRIDILETRSVLENAAAESE